MIVITHFTFVFNQSLCIYNIIISYLCISIYYCHFTYKIPYSHFCTGRYNC